MNYVSPPERAELVGYHHYLGLLFDASSNLRRVVLLICEVKTCKKGNFFPVRLLFSTPLSSGFTGLGLNCGFSVMSSPVQ